ncbi:MAG: FAD-dependent oxidoreductase [Mycoplasmataceae bacterium]|jgi:thioredoxin reductase (NADPH)|nr:FAD-dependent oxidoreductase [Mycoplasmataceae bacterium]
MALESIISNDQNTYDVIIVGGGPAALSCSIYLKKSGLKVAFIEKNIPGGKLLSLTKINNLIGYENISGADLAISYFNHTNKLGVEFIYDEVLRIAKKNQYYIFYTSSKTNYFSKYVVIATGVKNASLGIPGEKDYVNKGVSYCVTCDKSLIRNKTVILVGDYEEAVELSLLAKKVYFLSTYSNNLNPKIKVINSTIVAIIGNNDHVTSVILDNGEEIVIDHVFINQGGKPELSFAYELNLEIKDGIITTDPNSKVSSISEIYAIGDVSKSENRQVSTAISDGALAAMDIVAKIVKK